MDGLEYIIIDVGTVEMGKVAVKTVPIAALTDMKEINLKKYLANKLPENKRENIFKIVMANKKDISQLYA